MVEYGEFRARQIKQKLDELGADSSSCFDKESLLNKLVDTIMSVQAEVHKLPLVPEQPLTVLKCKM